MVTRTRCGCTRRTSAWNAAETRCSDVGPIVCAGPKTVNHSERPRHYGEDAETISRSTEGAFTVDPDGTGAAPAFSFGDPTFNIRSLRGNAVLRWEYRPGSALYFVWQQQRSDFEPIGNFELGRDVGRIFRTIPTNIFLLKAAYWFNR